MPLLLVTTGHDGSSSAHVSSDLDLVKVRFASRTSSGGAIPHREALYKPRLDTNPLASSPTLPHKSFSCALILTYSLRIKRRESPIDATPSTIKEQTPEPKLEDSGQAVPPSPEHSFVTFFNCQIEAAVIPLAL
jgi:hypothetical protein